jgi:hypothetical protein
MLDNATVDPYQAGTWGPLRGIELPLADEALWSEQELEESRVASRES